MDPMVFEILKAFIGPITAVGLAWLVGNRISATWALRQRRREQSLATVAEFYRLYGEFFALWKMCNYAIRDSKGEIEETTLWDLMRRATALEASGEAILLRISSELPLGEDDVRTQRRWAELYAEEAGHTFKFRILPPELTGGTNDESPRNFIMDNSRFRADTGFTDPVDLKEAIKRTHDWAVAHPEALNKVRVDYAGDKALADAYDAQVQKLLSKPTPPSIKPE